MSTHRKRSKGNRRQHINNVSLDSTSSTNFSDLYTNDSENGSDQMNKAKMNGRNKSDMDSNLTESIDITQYTSLSNTISNNNSVNIMNNKPYGVKESSSSSISSFDGIVSSSATSSNVRNIKDLNKSIEIDNEISKLRVEAAANASRMSPSKQQQVNGILRKPHSFSLSSSSNSKNGHDMDTMIPFSKKIQELENYSTIIENAASKMDCIVQNMTEVYQSYDENRFYIESPTHEDQSPIVNNSVQASPINIETSNIDNEKSLYDVEVKADESAAYSIEKKIYNMTDSMHSDTLTSFDEKLKLDLKQEIK